MSSGTGYASVPGGRSDGNPAEKLKQRYINNAASVADKTGTGAAIKGRWMQLNNAGGIKTANFRVGSNITELLLFAKPVAGTAALAGDEYVVVAVDPENLVQATTMLTQVESLDNDISWLPVPVNELTRIPLTAALVNGTFSAGCISAKTVGGIALDLWIGGQ